MNFMRKILGNSYLELTCSKEALFEIIEKYIEGKETHFSFSELCNHVKRIAVERNYFKKEPNTIYSDIEFLNNDMKQINLIIWEKIINKELMIDFNQGYANQFSNQYYFLKI